MKSGLRLLVRLGHTLIAIAYSGLAPAAYTLIPFDYPGSTQTQAFSINQRLEVPGRTEAVAFIYDFAHKTFSTLPLGPSGLLAEPSGLNDRGISAGKLVDSTDTSGGTFHLPSVVGFIFDGSSYTLLNYGSGPEGRGINNAGTVTGFSETGEDATSLWVYDPSTSTFTDVAIPGSFKILQGINSAGDMVGSTRAPPGELFPGSVSGAYGFVRSASGTVTYFRVNERPTRARGINDFGQVVGNFDDHDGITKGFITTAPSGGAYVPVSIPETEYLVAPGYAVTSPEGINNTGFISGVLTDASETVSSGFVAVKANYGGLWWNANESGWGIQFAHQGDTIFATWFTYDANGKAWWLTMTANKTAEGVYSGQLIRTNGAPFSAYMPPATPTVVGTGRSTFTSATTGTFAYTVSDGANVATQTKAIELQTFGPVPTCIWGALQDLTKASNFQDQWWAAPAGSASGWGVNLTQQGTTIFATWFTYDANRNPLWLSVTATQAGPNGYTGTLYLTNGPAFGAMPFDPTKVIRKAVGDATFTFSDGNNGTFAYNVDLGDGVNKANQVKAITRQVFGTPGTVCQ
jgi:hypothetical protein